MPLINHLKYKKKAPWRDAKLFIIVCEGERRETDYFNYFDGRSRRLKVVAVASEDGKSAPQHLLANAQKAAKQYDDGGDYELWIVMDVDRWQLEQLIEPKTFCKDKANWSVALSNPYFEVWLYAHFMNDLPNDTPRLNQCKTWKGLVHELGPFDSNHDPQLLPTAIENAQTNYEEDGYIPKVGSTQLYLLGKQLHLLIQENIR